MNNIVLIGMPGAGKSTVGVVLAKMLNYNFIDCDLVIQSETGLLLHQIIERDGLDGFLKTEEAIVSRINAASSVIATGGSAVFGEKAMEHLKCSGTVVYLKLSAEAVEKRIFNLATRGIAMKEGQTLKDIYDIRVPLYERYADITIDCENCTLEEVVKKIEAAIK